MKVQFELNQEDADQIASLLESGNYKPGTCWLSVHLDAVDNPNCQVWTGAYGHLLLTRGLMETIRAAFQPNEVHL